jgi:hypothetical protein
MDRPSPVAESFGQLNFGAAQLGDRRRTARLVALADAIVRHPGGTLPQKLHSPPDLKALYRLCARPEVTHAALLKSHCERTLSRIADSQSVVLVLHDTTELDFTGHESLVEDLGQIGQGTQRGYLCHNSLAVDSQQREVIGLTNQILHCRAEVPAGETQAQSRQRASRESRLWLAGTASLPADRNIVDVCDRGADTFEMLEDELHSARRFVIRSARNRAIWIGHDADTDQPHTLLHDYARTLPALGTWILPIPGGHGRKQRQAVLQVAAAPVLVRAPHVRRGEHRSAPLPLWIVRVWETDPFADEEHLEWLLLTNHPGETFEEARQVVTWYECRWILEEYHKAQKTGCGIETLQFTHVDRLQAALALLSVVALSLLNLRDAARRPDARTRPATHCIGEDYVAVLSAWRHKRPRMDWSVHEFFMGLARLGGHQNRKRDKPPGWLILWRGWTRLQAMLDGADAYRYVLKKCG